MKEVFSLMLRKNMKTAGMTLWHCWVLLGNLLLDIRGGGGGEGQNIV